MTNSADPLRLSPISVRSLEAEIDQAREHTVARICQVFAAPPELLCPLPSYEYTRQREMFVIGNMIAGTRNITGESEIEKSLEGSP